jgi:hypothetical protein
MVFLTKPNTVLRIVSGVCPICGVNPFNGIESSNVDDDAMFNIFILS